MPHAGLRLSGVEDKDLRDFAERLLATFEHDERGLTPRFLDGLPTMERTSDQDRLAELRSLVRAVKGNAPPSTDAKRMLVVPDDESRFIPFKHKDLPFTLGIEASVTSTECLTEVIFGLGSQIPEGMTVICADNRVYDVDNPISHIDELSDGRLTVFVDGDFAGQFNVDIDELRRHMPEKRRMYSPGVEEGFTVQTASGKILDEPEPSGLVPGRYENDEMQISVYENGACVVDIHDGEKYTLTGGIARQTLLSKEQEYYDYDWGSRVTKKSTRILTLSVDDDEQTVTATIKGRSTQRVAKWARQPDPKTSTSTRSIRWPGARAPTSSGPRPDNRPKNESSSQPASLKPKSDPIRWIRQLASDILAGARGAYVHAWDLMSTIVERCETTANSLPAAASLFARRPGTRRWRVP